MEHLYSLGHRQIAVIRGPKPLSDSAPRWKGIRTFAQAHRLELSSRLILDLPESRDPMSGFDNGFKLVGELLKRRQPFSAVLAFDDMSALGAIRALAKAGVRVPDQVSVIGFDDIAPASMCTPALTTVRQPMEPMGSLSVGILLEAAEAMQRGRDFSAVHRKVAPELVVRESTARAHSAGRLTLYRQKATINTI
jgi:LacI family transcriptional regulator